MSCGGGTLEVTRCWPTASYTSAKVCSGLLAPRWVPLAGLVLEGEWTMARRALGASAEAVVGSVAVALEPELVEVLPLLLPGRPGLLQAGWGPARCGCTHVGLRSILAGLPAPEEGASVEVLLLLLRGRPWLLQAGRGPGRCGCTRVGMRLILAGLPAPVGALPLLLRDAEVLFGRSLGCVLLLVIQTD